ncbi:hypothetical protein [Streptomyces sp. ALI-76-A]|uniref:hypothetical protein n=1 Tax=Streptomyces sp. ALI-76-A TaxID=3025736 RepID=UPI00256EEAB3|nr:hypothetical protein [Streptomyces sp. ALI-76-A]MDL5203113.1 hypothetical protein [Streptomyces sp. ALI-76-A]
MRAGPVLEYRAAVRRDRPAHDFVLPARRHRLLVAVFLLLCGWVEDLAAKKRPRSLP